MNSWKGSQVQTRQTSGAELCSRNLSKPPAVPLPPPLPASEHGAPSGQKSQPTSLPIYCSHPAGLSLDWDTQVRMVRSNSPSCRPVDGQFLILTVWIHYQVHGRGRGEVGVCVSLTRSHCIFIPLCKQKSEPGAQRGWHAPGLGLISPPLRSLPIHCSLPSETPQTSNPSP